MQGQFKSKVVYYINNHSKGRQVRISRQSKSTGCKTPKALSLNSYGWEIAAMKINKQKFTPRQEKNRKAINDNKTKTRSPNEADLNKRRSLKKQRRNES